MVATLILLALLAAAIVLTNLRLSHIERDLRTWRKRRPSTRIGNLVATIEEEDADPSWLRTAEQSPPPARDRLVPPPWWQGTDEEWRKQHPVPKRPRQYPPGPSYPREEWP